MRGTPANFVQEISSFSNPHVKFTRSLREKKQRKASGKFLAEGLRILTEALEVGVVPEMLWFGVESAAHSRVQALVAACAARGGKIFQTQDDILSKISGKDNPQSVLGIYAEPDTRLEELERHTADIWLVAQELRDPGNIGTLLRTGDAVGAGGLILLDGAADPYSVEAVRASMGAIFTQKLVQCSWGAFIAWLRQGEGQLVATSLNTDLDYQAPRYSPPVFLLIGNESQGLPTAYEAQCDLKVKMPMLGKADSLNAAVAGAVMAYEVLNQQRTMRNSLKS